MKILIELPTWLGDTVMATSAIENIFESYDNHEISLIGPESSLCIFRYHRKVKELITLEKTFSRLIRLRNYRGKFNILISFRSSLRTKLIRTLISPRKFFQFDKKRYPDRHQVEKYVHFVNDSLNISLPSRKNIIYGHKKRKKNTRYVGFNPGAKYGDAKRWTSQGFIKLGQELSKNLNIKIFGSKDEVVIARKIESGLITRKINNLQNLAGKTTLEQLIHEIANLDLLITGDSGPMHIASAFNVPTVAIFGPTKHFETSQWLNPQSSMVALNLECQPCMKRTCPLGHHKCMEDIDYKMIIREIEKLTLD